MTTAKELLEWVSKIKSTPKAVVADAVGSELTMPELIALLVMKQKTGRSKTSAPVDLSTPTSDPYKRWDIYNDLMFEIGEDHTTFYHAIMSLRERGYVKAHKVDVFSLTAAGISVNLSSDIKNRNIDRIITDHGVLLEWVSKVKSTPKAAKPEEPEEPTEYFIDWESVRGDKPNHMEVDVVSAKSGLTARAGSVRIFLSADAEHVRVMFFRYRPSSSQKFSEILCDMAPTLKHISDYLNGLDKTLTELLPMMKFLPEGSVVKNGRRCPSPDLMLQCMRGVLEGKK